MTNTANPGHGRPGMARWLRRELPPLLLTIALLVVARSSFANHYVVPSGSMEPTLVPGDRVVVEGTDRLREGTRMNIVASDEKARAAATEEGDKSTAKPFGSDTPVQDSGKSE